jgi:hypothetical protein
VTTRECHGENMGAVIIVEDILITAMLLAHSMAHPLHNRLAPSHGIDGWRFLLTIEPSTHISYFCLLMSS